MRPARSALRTLTQSKGALLIPDMTADLDRSARDWVPVLARYREPSLLRSFWEVGVTLAAFLGFWALALVSLNVHWALGLALSPAIGVFLVRLFAIQHDCGHNAFFADRRLNDWLGRALGCLTLTPYDVWRRLHAVHHSAAGNLDRRGIGDVVTLTVDEYRARGRWGRFGYRLYRNPAVMFGLGPAWLFVLNNRLPVGLMKAGPRYWISAMATNLGLVAALTGLWFLGGFAAIFAIWLPSVLVGATIGVWLFYVQHQFEAAHWDHEEDWSLHDAALHGSSHYVLPQPLQWLTANLGLHHIHHLQSRLPFYRLPEVLRDFPPLAQAQRMTIRESLVNARLHLWDPESRRLLSWRDARHLV
jgi:acyl-lipid omega-6 desaturase (Delta-12 desaturase)